MATVKLPNISPIQTQIRELQVLIKQLQQLREAILIELQRLEDNKADA